MGVDGAISSKACTGAATIKFPRPLKRGAKVRKGPCAQVILFPAPLTGDALAGCWAWLKYNHADWKIEDVSGRYSDPADWNTLLRVHEGVALARGEEFTENTMRREIAAFRAVIEKRNRIKDWLQAEGIDWNESPDSQAAVEFLYYRWKAQPLGAA